MRMQHDDLIRRKEKRREKMRDKKRKIEAAKETKYVEEGGREGRRDRE